MSFASIKVRKEDKLLFDRLLHESALRTGRSPSQHDLFHRIIEHALQNKEALMVVPPKPRRSWQRYQFELDEATDAAADLDRVVYGL